MRDPIHVLKADAMDRLTDLWIRLVATERVVSAVHHALEHSLHPVSEEIVQAMREGGFWVGEQKR